MWIGFLDATDERNKVLRRGGRLMFDLFQKPKDDLIEELVPAYGLEWIESDVSMIRGSASPNWWRGTISGQRFGIRTFGRTWEVYIGSIPGVIDVELTRIGSRRSCPVTEPCLEDFIPAGHPLAMKFYISMLGHDDRRFHGPQFTDSQVATELARFDDAVEAITVYRSGLELNADRALWNRATFDDDLLRASKITRSLEQYAEQNPGDQDG